MRLARSPIDRVTALAVLALLMLLPAAAARAQGTDGAIPDPVTGRELDRIARQLNLSDQQRLAIDPMHERYLAEFGSLREGQIEKFLSTSRSSLMGFMTRPDTKAAKEMLDDLDRILVRIRQLDEGLFDEMQGVLTEAQAEQMPLVRRMRERTRLRFGLTRVFGFINPGAFVDLVEIVDGLAFIGEAADRIAPLVAVHAESSTSQLRTLGDEASRAVIQFVERMEIVLPEIQEQAARNPREAMRAFQQVEIVLREIAAEPLERAAKVAASNRREAATFINVLPSDEARRFRTEYLRKAYPEIEKSEATMRGRFDLALARPLGDDARTQVEDLRLVTEAQHEALSDRLMNEFDEKRTALPPFGFGARGGQGRNAVDGRISELESRRGDIDAAATQQLLAILDLEDVEALRATAVQIAAEPSSEAPRVARRIKTRVAGNLDRLARTLDPPAGGDALLPAAMGAEDFGEIVERVGIDEDSRIVASTLHDDYESAWTDIVETRVRPAVGRVADRWGFDTETGELKTPTVSDIDEVYAMRAQALASMLELDDRLFSDLSLLPGADEARIEIERTLRLRTALNRGEAPLMANMPRGRRFAGARADGREERIDMVRLADVAIDDAEIRKRLDPILREYDGAATPLFRARYDALVASSRAMEVFALQMAEIGRGGAGGGPEMTASQQLERTLEQSSIAVAELNRATLDRLRGEIDASLASSMSDLYRRAANPDVYRDPGSAEPVLLAALDLDDLTAQQETQIGDLLLSHRADYETLCDRLLSLESDEGDAEDPREGIQRREERRLEMQRLRFERNELNERTVRRLRGALSEVQRAVLGIEG